MRTFLAFVIFAGGMLMVNAPADAARKSKRSTERYHYAPSYYVPRREAECARARHEDPTGLYAGYPCWAREALGRGTQGGGRGGRR